jgi:hypothetical protein
MIATPTYPAVVSTVCNEVGLSDEANRVHRDLAESLRHYLGPRMDQLIPEIREAGADTETVDTAIHFASLLPRFAPVPETSVDPDGEISFDWFGPSGKMFSVSVNKSGRLSYAGLFENKNRSHGTETLGASFPPTILNGLVRATTE